MAGAKEKQQCNSYRGGIFKKLIIAWRCLVSYPLDIILEPNTDEPELKIEDCKLNICGCRSRSAGACAACRSVLFKMLRIP
jgi:hypothetical protein